MPASAVGSCPREPLAAMQLRWTVHAVLLTLCICARMQYSLIDWYDEDAASQHQYFKLQVLICINTADVTEVSSIDMYQNS